jgi:hypothetical protein
LDKKNEFIVLYVRRCYGRNNEPKGSQQNESFGALRSYSDILRTEMGSSHFLFDIDMMLFLVVMERGELLWIGHEK